LYRFDELDVDFFHQHFAEFVIVIANRFLEIIQVLHRDEIVIGSDFLTINLLIDDSVFQRPVY
jgi:hypothetical protein